MVLFLGPDFGDCSEADEVAVKHDTVLSAGVLVAFFKS